MDIANRASQIVTVVVGAIVIYEFGEKRKWWSMSVPADWQSYILLGCLAAMVVVSSYLLWWRNKTGVVLDPLEPMAVEASQSRFRRSRAKITFLNRTKKPVDIYWIDESGNRKLLHTLLSYSEWPCATYLTQLFVAVVSGTGDSHKNTGTTLAGFEAKTTNGDTAIITVPDKSDMRALPVTATNGDRQRRDRAIESFEKLTVPQKFVLRWLLKYPRLNRQTLIQCGQGVGFSEPDGYLNLMRYQDCELIRFEPGEYLTINPVFLDDVAVIVAAWCVTISSPSEAL